MSISVSQLLLRIKGTEQRIKESLKPVTVRLNRLGSVIGGLCGVVHGSTQFLGGASSVLPVFCGLLFGGGQRFEVITHVPDDPIREPSSFRGINEPFCCLSVGLGQLIECVHNLGHTLMAQVPENFPHLLRGLTSS